MCLVRRRVVESSTHDEKMCVAAPNKRLLEYCTVFYVLFESQNIFRLDFSTTFNDCQEYRKQPFSLKNYVLKSTDGQLLRPNKNKSFVVLHQPGLDATDFMPLKPVCKVIGLSLKLKNS